MSVKRKVKSLVKNNKHVKRNVKTIVKKVKHVKRKVKTLSKNVVKRKRKVKSKVKKIISNSNSMLKKGYCEATILDENELDDPCYMHTSENECLEETRDNEYWRSYDCKWKK